MRLKLNLIELKKCDLAHAPPNCYALVHKKKTNETRFNELYRLKKNRHLFVVAFNSTILPQQLFRIQQLTYMCNNT